MCYLFIYPLRSSEDKKSAETKVTLFIFFKNSVVQHHILNTLIFGFSSVNGRIVFISLEKFVLNVFVYIQRYLEWNINDYANTISICSR